MDNVVHYDHICTLTPLSETQFLVHFDHLWSRDGESTFDKSLISPVYGFPISN